MTNRMRAKMFSLSRPLLRDHTKDARGLSKEIKIFIQLWGSLGKLDHLIKTKGNFLHLL